MSRRPFRVCTYNIHKAVGLDRQTKPERILEVMREIDADLYALQEVLSLPHATRELDQARYYAEELQYMPALGEARTIRGGSYGNLTLSRFPLCHVRTYDLSVPLAEPRLCLRTDVSLDAKHVLHVFNVHLGTSYLERRHQGKFLVAGDLLTDPALQAPRLVMGDFNEWTRGLASRLLASHLESADVKLHLRWGRTYPGVLPFLHLDHIYYEQRLKLERLYLHRSRLALRASDHLPLVADFTWADAGPDDTLAPGTHDRRGPTSAV